MSTVLRLPSVPGVRLALPLWRGSGGRVAWRRRAAFGLALLVLAVVAVVAVLVATGRVSLPGAGPAPAVPAQGMAPRAAAAEAGSAQAKAQAQAQAQRLAWEARAAADRVVAPRFSASLFAQHSWFVLPPAPKPAPPPPPPEPTAPPFPYTFVGSYAPAGDAPVFFLAQRDRVIDAHVGDRLDGVYQFESAAGGQLVFVYLPLNIRQNLAAGAPK